MPYVPPSTRFAACVLVLPRTGGPASAAERPVGFDADVAPTLTNHDRLPGIARAEVIIPEGPT